MKDFYAGSRGVAALFGAAFFLLTAAAEPSPAQRGGPGATAAGRRIDTLNRQGAQYERDHLGSDPKSPSDAPRDRRRAEETAKQVSRDFEGLQAGYNKIVLAMSSPGSLDLDSVLESVAEVRKCAGRLREHLALPRPKEDAEGKTAGEPVGATVEASLLSLRKHIYSFVTNPLFEAPPVLNVEQAGKAGRDLDMILQLSDAIGRSAGRPKARQH